MSFKGETLFNTGEIVPTPLVIKKARAYNIDLMELIMNHAEGNWSFLTPTEKKWNEVALEEGRPIYSRFKKDDQMFIFNTDQRENKTYIHMIEEL